MKIMDFDNENSLNDIIDNDTMSDDEVVASYGPPRSLFFQSLWGSWVALGVERLLYTLVKTKVYLLKYFSSLKVLSNTFLHRSFPTDATTHLYKRLCP